jgi:hypothetical protein
VTASHFVHYETDRFIATFGTIPGYERPGNPWPMSVFVREWGKVVEQIEPVISATVSHAEVVYPYEGSMVSEPIFTVMGVRNPYYVPDEQGENWRIAVQRAVDSMRVVLRQTTSQVVFDRVDAHYFRED